MADITSAQTGNYELTTTWVGGVIPISTDNVIIASTHTVTCTDTRACTNFTVYGGFINVNGGIFTPSGAILFSPTATGDGIIDFQGGSQFYPASNTLMKFTGSTTLHPILRATATTISNPAKIGDITGTYYFGFDGVSANTYTDRIEFDMSGDFVEWYSIDDGTAYFINNGEHFSSHQWSMPNHLFVDCGTIRFGSGSTPNSSFVFDFRNCDFRNPRYKTIIEYASDDAIVAYRGWGGSTVVGDGTQAHRFYISAEPTSGTIDASDLVLRDCGINNIATALVAASNNMIHQVYDSGSEVLIQMSSLVGVGGSNFTNTLLHTDNTNAHTMSASGTSTNQNDASGARIFSSHAGSNPILFGDKIKIKNIVTVGGSGISSTGGSADTDIGSNTHIDLSTDINAGLLFETNAYTGLVDYKNTLVIQRGGIAYGYMVRALSPIVNQSMNTVGGNCWYNLTGTYSNIGTITDDQRALDINADPQLVNVDANFASWDTSLGGLGTVVNAFDEALKKNGRDKNGILATFDTNYTAANAESYFDGEFAPTNIALQGSGIGGVDMGALPVQVTTITSSGSLQADDSTVSGSLTIVPSAITSSGSLQADDATISGSTTNDPVSATVFTTITTAGGVAGTLQADDATLSGNMFVSNEIKTNLLSLTLTTYTADVSASNEVTANVDALTLVTHQAAISVGNNIAATAAVLELLTHTAEVSVGNDISANVDVLTMVDYPATIIGGAPTSPLNQGLEYTIPDDLHHYDFEEED